MSISLTRTIEVPPVPVIPTNPPPHERGVIRRFVMRIPVLGRGLRYLKSWVLLPRTIRQNSAILTAIFDDCRQRFDALEGYANTRSQASIDRILRAIDESGVETKDRLARTITNEVSQLRSQHATSIETGVGTMDRLAQAITNEVSQLRSQHATSIETGVGTMDRLAQAITNEVSQLRTQHATSIETSVTTMDRLAQAMTDEVTQLRNQHASSFDLVVELCRDQTNILTGLEAIKLDRQLASVIENQTDSQRRLTALGENIHGQVNWLEKLTDADQSHDRWLQAMSETIKNLNDWLGLLKAKLEILALDVRERVRVVPDTSELPEPRILDPESYQAKVGAMPDGIRINLGCGEKPLPEYINIDFRDMPGIDVAADIRRLPFDTGSLAEIASSHLVEHFRRHTFQTLILPYWSSLLKPHGGQLRIICPNWAAMIRRLDSGEMPLDQFHIVTFGGQDYGGDDHFAMYTPETLSRQLTDAGFSRVEVITEERMNGMCPEMEILATR